MLFFKAFIASLIMVFLKGYQHQNVIGGHFKMSFGFSYLLAIADVFVISLVATNGLSTIIPIGLGSSIGIVISMKLHRVLNKVGVENVRN